MSSPECLFCRIARGEVTARVVHESEGVIAFLDIRPIRSGHVLIVPKEHFPYYDDLPAELANEVMRFATPSWHSLPYSASPRARDGEVPFIR